MLNPQLNGGATVINFLKMAKRKHKILTTEDTQGNRDKILHRII